MGDHFLPQGLALHAGHGTSGLPDLWRAQFPALEQRIGDSPLAYLDNAATTQMPYAVLDAMQRFETRIRANIHRGVHTLSQRATDAFEDARDTLKGFVGAGREHELIFTSGATEALNLVALGLSQPGERKPVLRPGDEIVVSVFEHHANLVPWQQAARRNGASLRVLTPDAAGQLRPEALDALLNKRTRIVALTACANATGYRPPFETLLAQAAEAGAITVLDAAQIVGHGELQLETLDCDFIAFSGHKMYGPMGVGALVGRRAALERLMPLRLGGDMVEWVTGTDAAFAQLPSRLEGGTPNVAGAVGMAAAADFIETVGRDAIQAHIGALRARAAEWLTRIPGIQVFAPHANPTSIVAFIAAGVHPHDIGTLLDEQGIAVRTGHHCAQPLIDHFGLGPTTRASFALYNTAEEVDRLVAGVARAMEVLR